MKAGMVAAVVMVSAVLGACSAPIPEAERRWRAEREEGIRSAVPERARETVALRFYPYGREWKVHGMLEPMAPQPLMIPASSGPDRPAHRVGRLRLRLPGGDAVLAVYQLDDLRAEYPDTLFLPFRDAGAGTVTYGAGRYVEIERLAGGVLEVDFNRAYNPDCAYGLAARCPVTPAENTLPFAVEAGEKLPAGEMLPGGHE